MAASCADTAAVLYDKVAAVAVISLNRPECLNAYDMAMRDALHGALLAVRDDPEVRAVVLCGNGAAFSTGGDVREFGSAPSPVGARQARWQRDNWGLMRRLRPPLIAAVHGYAAGGGFEMALLCDLVLASPDATFWYPESALGMIPGVGGTQTTARQLGQARALDLLLTGRRLTARQAHEWGIVTQIVQRRRLRVAALALAQRLALLPAHLVTNVKRAVDEGLDLDLGSGLDLERRLAGGLRAWGLEGLPPSRPRRSSPQAPRPQAHPTEPRSST